MHLAPLSEPGVTVLYCWALSPSFHLSLEVVLILYYFFFQPLMHLALLPEPGHGVVVVFVPCAWYLDFRVGRHHCGSVARPIA